MVLKKGTQQDGAAEEEEEECGLAPWRKRDILYVVYVGCEKKKKKKSIDAETHILSHTRIRCMLKHTHAHIHTDTKNK